MDNGKGKLVLPQLNRLHEAFKRSQAPPRRLLALRPSSPAHDWMVSVLGPLFRTAGHTVRTQHRVTASAGQRRGDEEIRNYLRDQAGSRVYINSGL